MDTLKNQLARIRQQLGALTATQKMLAFTLVIIAVGAVIWMAKYAGTAVMEPVLDQSFNAEDISRVTARLASRGIAYEVQGDRILVPTDRKFEVIADLGYAQLLPRDTKNAFDEMTAKSSPWDPKSKTDQLFNEARCRNLAAIIRNFPRVNGAMVQVDPTSIRGIGDSSVQPSASININMKPGQPVDNKLVSAAADLVAGAVANLARNRIRVVVDGVSYPVYDRDDAAGVAGDWLERVRENEKYFARKLSDQLSFIQGVMISVTVEPNNKSLQVERNTVDPKSAVVKPIHEETHTVESTAPRVPSGEPGVTSNGAMSVGAVGDDSGKSTEETTKTDNQVLTSTIHEWERNPGGEAVVKSASVFIPRSYFVRVFKSRNPGGKEPDEAVLQPLIDVELPKIRSSVKTCLALASDAAVHVDTYTDLTGAVASADAPVAASTGGIAVLDHAKEIAVGALALVSLFMVSAIVKKTTPAPVAPSVAEIRPPAHLSGTDDLVGEVGGGTAMLDGMELDEDSVRTQQMLDQVSTMVKENPDGAAALIKRWLNRA